MQHIVDLPFSFFAVVNLMEIKLEEEAREVSGTILALI